jgi:hypothetical protein
VLLQVGGDSLRAFAKFITPNLAMGRWSFYIIFGAVQLMLSMVSLSISPHTYNMVLLHGFLLCRKYGGNNRQTNWLCKAAMLPASFSVLSESDSGCVLTSSRCYCPLLRAAAQFQ